MPKAASALATPWVCSRASRSCDGCQRPSRRRLFRPSSRRGGEGEGNTPAPLLERGRGEEEEGHLGVGVGGEGVGEG